MRGNLPKRYEEKFLKKIFNFFREKSYRRKTLYEYDESEEKIDSKAKYDISAELKRKIKNEETKTKIIEIIEQNPEMLEVLPESKLQIISDIYDEKIQKVKNEINILKNKNNI